MKSIIYTVLGVGLITGVCAAPPAFSADPPPTTSDERYSSRFAESGRIDSINSKKGKIVVDDRLFLLSNNARVYTTGGTPGLLSMLKQGTRIAFNTAQREEKSYPTIIEILILQ